MIPAVAVYRYEYMYVKSQVCACVHVIQLYECVHVPVRVCMCASMAAEKSMSALHVWVYKQQA
jgi:hypothetical protein